MSHSPVFGITGWKNAGKTTLTAALIKYFSDNGYRVSSIKHAHHEFDVDQAGTDSYKHRQSGAGEVMLASSKRFALMHEYKNNEPELDLSSLLDRMAPADIVLVEGFKTEDIPKIELRRAETKSDPMTARIPGIVAIASDDAAVQTENSLPLLDLNNVPAIADFIINHLSLKEPTS